MHGLDMIAILDWLEPELVPLVFVTLALLFLWAGLGHIGRLDRLRQKLARLSRFPFWTDVTMDLEKRRSEALARIREAKSAELSRAFALFHEQWSRRRGHRAIDAGQILTLEALQPDGLASRVAPHASALFTRFGILGALAGLAIGLRKVGAGGVDELLGSALDMLGGMRLAFAASILGLSLSQIWSMLENVAHEGARAALAQLVTAIACLFPAPSERETLEEIASAAQKGCEQLEQLGATVGEGVGSSLREEISAGIGALSGRFESVVSGIGAAHMAVVRQLTHEFLSKLGEAVAGERDSIAQTAKALCEWQAAAGSTVNTLVEKGDRLHTGLETLLASVGDLTAAAREVASGAAAVGQNQPGLLAQLGGCSQKLAELFVQVQDAQETLTARRLALAQDLEKRRLDLGGVDRSVEEMRTVLGDFARAFPDHAELAASRVASAIEPSLQLMALQINDVRGLFRSGPASMQATAAEVRDVLERFNTDLARTARATTDDLARRSEAAYRDMERSIVVAGRQERPAPVPAASGTAPSRKTARASGPASRSSRAITSRPGGNGAASSEEDHGQPDPV